MGAYSPAPIATEKVHQDAMKKVMYPRIRELKGRGIT
ncbi:MAG: hypothetical protein K6348_08995, partial [Deferribacterales bacterium]